MVCRRAGCGRAGTGTGTGIVTAWWSRRRRRWRGAGWRGRPWRGTGS
uniref:Uncharacterized protein n=1 Tax=Arundo donax TaxID=35708 RepID=A0A0A9F520_ARUDO